MGLIILLATIMPIIYLAWMVTTPYRDMSVMMSLMVAKAMMCLLAVPVMMNIASV